MENYYIMPTEDVDLEKVSPWVLRMVRKQEMKIELFKQEIADLRMQLEETHGVRLSEKEVRREGGRVGGQRTKMETHACALARAQTRQLSCLLIKRSRALRACMHACMHA